MSERPKSLTQLRGELATAGATAIQLEAAAGEALAARNIPRYRQLSAEAAAAYTRKRELEALVRAGGQPKRHEQSESTGGYAWRTVK